MSNPIIDAIQWDVNNPEASSLLLQQQLALLQAEWDTKLSRQLRITSVGSKSIASFQDLPDHRSDEIDTYIGFDPSSPEIDVSSRYVRGELTPTLPFAGVGHKERYFLTQTSVLVPNAALNTTFLFNVTINLPRPAWVRGFHPLVIKSAGANPCSNLFRPQIDTVPVFAGDPSAIGSLSPRPGFLFLATVLNTETFIILEWTSQELLSAGSHNFRMDIFDTNYGGADSPANVAPFFNIYTSAIEVGTMPVAYVQPPVSYLEFTYL